MRLKILYYSLVFILIFVLSGFGFSWLAFISRNVLPAGETFIYQFEKGSTLRKLANDLQEFGLISHPNYLIILAKLKGQEDALQAGLFEFKGPIKIGNLLNQMADGDVMQSSLMIIEGWTIHDLIKAINANEVLVKTLEPLDIASITQALGIEHKTPEGLFYPETYHFPVGSTDVDFLKRAYVTMQAILAAEWEQRQMDLPYRSSYEALIAASLVERETAIKAERPIVGGVLSRRLKKGMRLQFDPTVIYGLGDAYTGELLLKDLAIETPYNTYIHAGLPPTPIAMPSQTSIRAVLQPDDSDALYFVADGKGGHVFSNTLQEHNKAVSNYRNRDKE